MAYSRQRTLGGYGRAVEPTVQPYTFPASVGGVNAVDSLMMMPNQDCLYTYNLMPSEYGLRLRKGFREWATGCAEEPTRTTNTDVRTVIPFESNIQDPANDRLFSVTSEGIWDTTLFNDTTPDQEVVFAETSSPAGFGVWTEFTGDAAGEGLRGHYLFYADGLNGIWQYEEALDAWAQPTAKGGTGPGALTPDLPDGWYYDNPDVSDIENPLYYLPYPVDDVAFVMVFKQRIWVILEDEDDGWYLPVASVTGELKKFTFGSKMAHGGNLMGLWTWTVDGGDGVDDMMVAISRGGDVIIYQGEDPEITPDGTQIGPWQTRGSWFIGTVPNSRRLVADYGPDLYVLSSYGVTSLNDLLRGAPAFGETPSQKVNRFLRPDVEMGADSPAWQMVVHPGDGFLQIITPKPTQTPYLQYNLNLQTRAWGFWEGVPVLGADTWNGDYFMGGENGVLNINDGTQDGTTLAGDVGESIDFRTLTSFQAPAGHSNFTEVGLIRTIGILSGTANLNVRAIYDYAIETPNIPPAKLPFAQESEWDSAIWDGALWDFNAEGKSITSGSLGLGRTFAVSTSGNATARITIIGWDCLFQTGGLI